MSTVISVENVSKQYRLGEVGTGTLSHDVNRWWHKVRGKEDPYLKIGESNDRSKKGDSEYSWALRDISFEVKQGEVLGIIGRNGAGKSTLLKILSRVTTPTTGNIKVKGRIASLLEVGTGFHPELTGRENIFLNGAILGMRKAEIASKFDEIVEFSGCERYIDTPVKRYSSGMYVRLAFAVAAHLEPEILIIDEVLAVGDAEFQKKCLGKMKDVAGEGRTVLFVSHNLAAMTSICSKGLLLQNGEIHTIGSIVRVIDEYNYNTSGSQNGHTAIITKPVGNHDPIIRSVSVLRDDLLTAKFEYGDNITIEVKFSSESDITKPLIGYLIRSQRGVDAVSSNNYFLPSSHFNEPVKSGTIRCSLGSLPLMAGRYSVSIWLGRNAHQQHHVEEVLHFDVIEKDIWSTGKMPASNLSCLWWPTEFKFAQPEDAI